MTVNGTETTKPIRVQGVDLNKVDVKVLRKVAAYVLGPDKASDAMKELVAQLQIRFLKDEPDIAKLATCDDCGGKSPLLVKYPGCPFCGAEDDDVPVKAEAPSAKKTNGSGKASAPALTLVGTLMPATQIKPSVALDDAIREVKKIKGDGAAWAWRLGKYVRENIFETDLWMKRNDADGKQAHKSFNAFCQAELGFEQHFVHRMMAVSKEFTEEDARLSGTTSLSILLSAPKEDLPKLMARLREGATTREIQSETTRLRQQKNTPVREPAKAGPANTKSRPTVPSKASAAAADARIKLADEKVTIVLAKKKQNIPLLNGIVKLKKGDEPRKARRVKDGPYAIIEGTNGASIEVKVIENAAGELILACTPHRKE